MAPPIRVLLFVAISALVACSPSNQAPASKSSVKALPIKLFATPEEAGDALQRAAKSADQAALLAILGPDSKELISSGDPVEDRNATTAFTDRYEVMHRWRRMDDASEVLVVGADNFPLPIPLRKSGSGQWFYDTAAGKEEILDRRIGQNELAVIAVCFAAAQAQAEYFAQFHDGSTTRQYAVKFNSDAGKQNGLYWPSAEGQPQSPLGPLVASATSEGYSVNPHTHAPFHGYFFRMLTRQTDNAPGGAMTYLVGGKMVNGFALVAYPARYGDSGIMTFMINQTGLLVQKDLGKASSEAATAMTVFDPEASWTPVEE
jgi:hypothetical protein